MKANFNVEGTRLPTALRSRRGLARRLGRAARLERLAERGSQQLLRLGGLPVAWSRVRVRVIGFGGHSQQD